MKLPLSLKKQNGYREQHFLHGNRYLHPSSNLVLLNPGPVLTSSRVRQAMAQVDLCHRDSAFSEVLSGVCSSLQQISDAPEHEGVLLSGGGTAATEAAFASFFSPEDKILIVSNGAFGERLLEIASIHQLSFHHLSYAWGKKVSCKDIEEILAKDKKIKTIAMVHHETSVGCLNPIQEVGEIASRFGLRFFVDVISSLGAEEFSAKKSNVSMFVGSANKCLHGIPGVSFLFAHQDVWTETTELKPRSVYLDLHRYRTAAREAKQTPFTPAVHALLALEEALKELQEEGGVSARRSHYLTLQNRLRQGLFLAGVSLFALQAKSSSSVTMANLPKDQSFSQLYEALRERGFVMYQPKGLLQQTCFIVANMGHLNLAMIESFLAAFYEIQEISVPQASAQS